MYQAQSNCVNKYSIEMKSSVLGEVVFCQSNIMKIQL